MQANVKVEYQINRLNGWIPWWRYFVSEYDIRKAVHASPRAEFTPITDLYMFENILTNYLDRQSYQQSCLEINIFQFKA